MCEQRTVGGGSCFLWQLVMLVEGFYVCWVCWVRVLGTTFIFLCMLLPTTPSLAFLVLVRIHCDFNKFYFDFFKKNIVHTYLIHMEFK